MSNQITYVLLEYTKAFKFRGIKNKAELSSAKEEGQICPNSVLLFCLDVEHQQAIVKAEHFKLPIRASLVSFRDCGAASFPAELRPLLQSPQLLCGNRGAWPSS